MESLGQAWAIAIKDLRHLVRDKAAAFFVLIFPLFVALLFGAVFSGGGGGGGGGGGDALEVVIFNEDAGEGSAKFVKALDDDDAIKVRSVESLEDGARLVRKGDVAACLHLRKGFDPQQIFGEGIRIEGVVDPKRTAEAGLLEGKLNQITFMQMSTMFTDPKASRAMMDKSRSSVRGGDAPAGIKLALEGLFASVDMVSGAIEKDDQEKAAGGGGEGGEKFTWQPVKVELSKLAIDNRGPPSAFAISFPQGVVWGLMGVVTGFAAGFAAERARGTLTRLNTAPVSAPTMLLGKALACFLACLLVQVLLVGMASIPVFHVPMGNPLLLLLVCVVTALSLSGLAMLIAGLSRTEEAAGGLARAALIVLALIGGGSMPIFFMPKFMRTVSGVSPFKWSTEALEGAMWRGFSLAELALPLGVLAGIGVLGFVVGSLAIARGPRA